MTNAALTKRPTTVVDATAFQPTDIESAWRIAKVVCASGMLQADTPEQAMAKGLMGAELGLTFMQSQLAFYTFESKGKIRTALWSERMLAIVRARGFRVVLVHDPRDPATENRTFAAWEGERDGRTTRATYTQEEAKRAGLWPKWQGAVIPEHMLVLRALSRLVRLEYGDVLGGVPTVEDLQDAAEQAPAKARVEPGQDPLEAALARETKAAEPEPVQAEEVVEPVVKPVSEVQVSLTNLGAMDEEETAWGHVEETAADPVDATKVGDVGLFEELQLLRGEILDLLLGDVTWTEAAWHSEVLPEGQEVNSDEELAKAVKRAKTLKNKVEIIAECLVIAQDCRELSAAHPSMGEAPWQLTISQLKGLRTNLGQALRRAQQR